MSVELKTVVHQLGQDGRCLLCGEWLPLCAWAVPGEFVGITEFRGGNKSGYRIGSNNRDKRCDGMIAEMFFQGPIDPKPPTKKGK